MLRGYVRGERKSRCSFFIFQRIFFSQKECPAEDKGRETPALLQVQQKIKGILRFQKVGKQKIGICKWATQNDQPSGSSPANPRNIAQIFFPDRTRSVRKNVSITYFAS